MVELKVIGQEHKSLSFMQFKTLEEYFVYLFLQDLFQNEKVSIKQFCDNFNLKIADIKQVISRFEQREILTYKTIVGEKHVVLEVELLEKQANNNYNDIEKKLSNVYYFADELIKTISDKMKHDNNYTIDYLKIIIMQILKKKKLVVKFENLQIDSQEDSLYFLKNFAPHEIFASWNLDMTEADRLFIFENIFEKNVSKELVNLAIDYTIKTNLYHSFNSDFAQKNINAWLNSEFTTVEQALDFIRDRKEREHEAKMSGNYVEPTWGKVEISENDIVSVDELERLLNE